MPAPHPATAGYNPSATMTDANATPLPTAGYQPQPPTPSGVVNSMAYAMPPQRSTGLVVGALLVGLLVGGAVIAAFLVGRGSQDSADMPPPVVAANTAGDVDKPAPKDMPPAARAPAATDNSSAATNEAPSGEATAKEKASGDSANEERKVALAGKDRARDDDVRSNKRSKRSSGKKPRRRKSSASKGDTSEKGEKDPAPDGSAKIASAGDETEKAEDKKPSRKPISSQLLTGAIRGNFGPANKCANTNITQHPKKQIGLMVDHCPSYQEIDPEQTLSLTVDEAGSVTRARFSSAAANKSKIGQCVLNSLKGWSFPEFENEGKPATIKRPIRFQECGPINGKCVFSKPQY